MWNWHDVSAAGAFGMTHEVELSLRAAAVRWIRLAPNESLRGQMSRVGPDTAAEGYVVAGRPRVPRAFWEDFASAETIRIVAHSDGTPA